MILTFITTRGTFSSISGRPLKIWFNPSGTDADRFLLGRVGERMGKCGGAMFEPGNLISCWIGRRLLLTTPVRLPSDPPRGTLSLPLCSIPVLGLWRVSSYTLVSTSRLPRTGLESLELDLRRLSSSSSQFTTSLFRAKEIDLERLLKSLSYNIIQNIRMRLLWAAVEFFQGPSIYSGALFPDLPMRQRDLHLFAGGFSFSDINSCFIRTRGSTITEIPLNRPRLQMCWSLIPAMKIRNINHWK